MVRGSELLKQGKLDLAQSAFRDALALEPENPRVLALLGLSHFRASAFAEARAIYEQLADRAPTDASHRLNLGLVYLKLNDAERAIAALETSRALDPSQGRAVSYLGLAYARAGRYAEAYRAFLLAGQNDLATEIESNLNATERDRIHHQIGRSPQGPLPDPAAGPGPTVPRTVTPRSVQRSTPPAGVPRAPIEPEAARTPTPHVVPRTRPPAAPPAKSRAPSQPGLPEVPPAPVPPAPAAAPEPAREPGGGSLAAVPEAVESDAESPAVARTVTPGGTVRITDSTQFVMPRAEPIAPAQGLTGPSMISHAVASATPSGVIRVRPRSGGAPPLPLSDLATHDLIRPDDGDEVFEIGPSGALVVRVAERVLTRLDGVHITGGDLSYELAMRRSRGHNTEQPFDHGGSQLHAVTGRGYLIAVPGTHAFTAVSLDDDILYLREDLVFAFEASLRWENGNVPGLRGKLPVVQFRGDGAVALRLARPLVRVKLPAQGVVFVDAERLAGWIGRVIPRAVVPPPGGPLGAMCVECTGEGIVLIEPAGDDPAAAHAAPGVGGSTSAPQGAPNIAPKHRADGGAGQRPGDRAGEPARRARRSVTMSPPALSPLDAAARLAGLRGRVLLHSAPGGEDPGRCSFLAAEPQATLIARGRSLVVLDAAGRPARRFTGDPLDAAEAFLAEHGCRLEPPGDGDPEPRVIGYLGYDLARVIDPLPGSAALAHDGPDLWLAAYGAVARWAAGELAIVGPDRDARRRLGEALARPARPILAPVLAALTAADDDAHHLARIERVRDHFAAGELGRIHLVRRLTARITAPGDALALYAALAEAAPAPYGALLEIDGAALVSGSSQRFLAPPAADAVDAADPPAGFAALLRATFPDGSVTGVPRARARRLIDELEPVRRGPYGGALGYFGAAGAFELAVAIRTAVMARYELRVHAGSQIVADSDAAAVLADAGGDAAAFRAALVRLEPPAPP